MVCSKSIDYRSTQSLFVCVIFQASSGREMDQKKGIWDSAASVIYTFWVCSYVHEYSFYYRNICSNPITTDKDKNFPNSFVLDFQKKILTRSTRIIGFSKKILIGDIEKFVHFELRSVEVLSPTPWFTCLFSTAIEKIVENTIFTIK